MSDILCLGFCRNRYLGVYYTASNDVLLDVRHDTSSISPTLSHFGQIQVISTPRRMHSYIQYRWGVLALHILSPSTNFLLGPQLDFICQSSIPINQETRTLGSVTADLTHIVSLPIHHPHPIYSSLGLDPHLGPSTGVCVCCVDPGLIFQFYPLSTTQPYFFHYLNLDARRHDSNVEIYL